MTAFKSFCIVDNFLCKLFPRQTTLEDNSMDISNPVVFARKDSDIELTMKELELEVEDMSQTRTSLNSDGNGKRLRRTSSFIERKKKQAKFKRKPSRTASNGSLLITGTSSRVHTIKDRFQERVFGKHFKQTEKVPPENTSCEKLNSLQETKANSSSKRLRKTRQNFKDEAASDEDEINSNFLPVIAKEDGSGVEEKRLQTKKSFNSGGKERHSRKKHWKPSNSFKTTLPPIAENCDCDLFPGSVDKIRLRGYRPSTPLPSLKEQEQKIHKRLAHTWMEGVLCNKKT
jgi:hypothetical protein